MPPGQGVDYQRYSNHAGHYPIGQIRQIPPNWQVLAVIDVEGGEHQDVRQPHPGDMKIDPSPPQLPSCHAAHRRRRKGKRTENEQVVILRPSHYREHRCRREEQAEAPVVRCPELRMLSSAFLAKHCNYSQNGADDSEQNVKTKHAEEQRRVRRQIESQNSLQSLSHLSASDWRRRQYNRWMRRASCEGRRNSLPSRTGSALQFSPNQLRSR